MFIGQQCDFESGDDSRFASGTLCISIHAVLPPPPPQLRFEVDLPISRLVWCAVSVRPIVFCLLPPGSLLYNDRCL